MTSGDAPHVLVTDDGPVRTLTLNRPATRNALSLTMLDALGDALDDPDVVLALVVALGPRPR